MARISVQSAKAKGRKLQQWVCQRISDYTGLSWGKDELIASREMGCSGTDVRLIGEALKKFPYSVECKAQESWSIHEWVKQAKENKMKGTEWLLFCKRNRQKPLVVMEADVFFRILND